MDELERALGQHFGFDKFRPGQREVIENILAHRHTLAVLPTGLGKSLCYQLAAQLLPGVTLVISPLIALMQDQVEALVDRGFSNVTYLNSALEPSQIGARYAEIERGRYKLVYVAPERCDSPRFQQLARQMRIDLVVIDEAHCISQWGHDFRPHYRTLLGRLPELKRATFLALTATATPAVQDDIAAALELPEIERVIADLNRPNLQFQVVRADQHEEKAARLAELLSEDKGPAIVYASTRKEAAQAHQFLQAEGFSACLYHAGLDSEQRARAQRWFQQDQRRIIVATVAFGMGIDKPDVRQVIHYNLPGSLESYYQEAGRGGRDGEPATCTLFYTPRDERIQRFLIDQAHPQPGVLLHLYEMLRQAHPLPVPAGDLATASELPEITINAAVRLLAEQQWLQVHQDGKYSLARLASGELKVDSRPLVERYRRATDRLNQMIQYATGRNCRRAQILNYFGQRFAPPCGGCDLCCAPAVPATQTQPPPEEATAASDRVARVILQTAADFGGRLGRLLIADVLSGSKRTRVIELGLEQSKHYGTLNLHRREQVVGWIDELIGRQLLRVTAEEYPRLCIAEAGRRALAEDSLLPLAGFARKSSAGHASEPAELDSAAISSSPRAGAVSSETFKERLKQWRREKAHALGVAAFVVLHDSVLGEIARRQPQTPAELQDIKGIGPSKVEKFGAEILALVRNPVSEPPLDLWLQVEVWRQGGREPDAQALLAALENYSGLERGGLISVINALKDLGIKQASDSLMRLLKETSDGNFLTAICDALGQLGATPAVPDVLPLLNDHRPSVRRAAVRALGRLRIPAALPQLARLANEDASENVRLAASAAVRLLNPPVDSA